MTSWDRVAVVACSGALGAVCRYWVGLYVRSADWAGPFPFVGTIVVNLLGCFLFGCIAQMVIEMELISPFLRLALLTGFLGAFTTFSAYSFDTLELWEQRGLLWAGAYVLTQNVLGIALAFFGVALVRWLSSPA